MNKSGSYRFETPSKYLEFVIICDSLNRHHRIDEKLVVERMIQSLPLLLLSLLLPPFASASFDCSFNIPPYHFDLSPLKGLHTAWKTVNTPPTIENSTVFLDLCQDLVWDSKIYPPEDRCNDGTQGSLSFYSY